MDPTRYPAVPPSIVCPYCQRRSYYPEDVAQGYCSNCGSQDELLRKEPQRNMDAEFRPRPGCPGPPPGTKGRIKIKIGPELPEPDLASWPEPVARGWTRQVSEVAVELDLEPIDPGTNAEVMLYAAALSTRLERFFAASLQSPNSPRMRAEIDLEF
jgi:hypothetical protein